MIFNPDTAPGHGKYYMPDFEATARSLRVAPISASVHSLGELEAVISALGREPDSGFEATADFFLFNNLTETIGLAARDNLPAIYPWREGTAAGGLLSYGPDLEDIVLRAAPYHISMRRNVLNLKRDDIATAQLAVDREIEHRQIAGASLYLQLGSNCPDVF